MYIDPNAPPPDLDAQTTRPSSSPGPGAIGSSLGDLLAAATSGALRVDRATGDATVRALDEVLQEVASFRRMGTQYGAEGTRLGGGYAEQIDGFNRSWTTEGDNSAFDVLTKYIRELERLKEAVRKSMDTYRETDLAGVRHLDQAGQTE